MKSYKVGDSENQRGGAGCGEISLGVNTEIYNVAGRPG